LTRAGSTSAAAASSGQKPLRAGAWAVGAVASFTAMAVAGREAGAHLDTFEIMTYRSLIGIALVLAAGAALGRLGEIRRDRLGLHALRNLFHFFGQNLWFFALATIPLAQVAALEFSYPVWVALAAPVVLGERLSLRRLLAVALGFAGILVVLRPGMVPINAGTLAALFCAFGFAGSAIVTRRLTADQTVTCILFWLTVMQAGMGLALAGADGAIRLPAAETLPHLAVIGVAGLGAHLCLTSALSLAHASVVAPMEFLRLPAITLAGMLLYAEPLDPFALIGGVLILAGIIVNLSQR